MRSAYYDVVADNPKRAREVEGAAFDRVIAKLEGARTAGWNSRTLHEALEALERLWSALLQDLAHPDNALPTALRAQLVSIGVWIMREIAGLRSATSRDLGGLIAVNAAIRAGLT